MIPRHQGMNWKLGVRLVPIVFRCSKRGRRGRSGSIGSQFYFDLIRVLLMDVYKIRTQLPYCEVVSVIELGVPEASVVLDQTR
jgi:hypothetical protein